MMNTAQTMQKTSSPNSEGTMGIEEPASSTRKSLSDLTEDELPSIEDIFRNITLLRNTGFTEDFFNEPVDIEKYLCPDYYVKITSPMDFGTMESKYKNGQYQNSKQVINDVNLIFQNAMHYNPPGFKIHEVAKDCSAILYRMILYSSSKRARGRPISKSTANVILIGEPTILMTAQSFLLRWMRAAFQFNFPQYNENTSIDTLVKKLMADAEEEYNYRINLNKKATLIKIYNQKPLNISSRQKGDQFPFYSVLFSLDDSELQDVVKDIPPPKKQTILAELIKYYGTNGSERKKFMADVIPTVASESHKGTPDDIICEVCKRGDNEEVLLLCDRCDKGYHCYCVVPQVTEIPEGQWYCPACSQAKITGETSPIRPTKRKKTESKESLSSSGNKKMTVESPPVTPPMLSKSQSDTTGLRVQTPESKDQPVKDNMDIDKQSSQPSLTPLPPMPPTMAGMKAPSNRLSTPPQIIHIDKPITAPPPPLSALPPKPIPPPIPQPTSSSSQLPQSTPPSNIPPPPPMQANGNENKQQPTPAPPPNYSLILDLLSSQREGKGTPEPQKQPAPPPPQQGQPAQSQAAVGQKPTFQVSSQPPMQARPPYPTPQVPQKQASAAPPRKVAAPPTQMANFNYPVAQKAMQQSNVPKAPTTNNTTTMNAPRPPSNPPQIPQQQQPYPPNQMNQHNQQKGQVSNGTQQGSKSTSNVKSTGKAWNTEDIEDSESDTTHSTPSSPTQDNETSNHSNHRQNPPSVISEAKSIMYGVTSGVQKMYQFVQVLEQALIERDQARADRDALIIRCQTLEQAMTSLQHNHDVWKSRHEIMQDKEKSLQLYVHEKEKHIQAVCDRLNKELAIAKTEQAKMAAENGALKAELLSYKQAMLQIPRNPINLS